VVPIVNENDAVADEEIVSGTTTGSRRWWRTCGRDPPGATHRHDGLLTADPRLDPSATLIEEVNAIDADLVEVAVRVHQRGQRGMASKLAAARMATWSASRRSSPPRGHGPRYKRP